MRPCHERVVRANDRDGAGLTAAPTSANTTAGVAVDTVGGSGNAAVVVTAAGMTGSPITVPVAVLAGDPKTGMHHTYLQLADGTRIPPHRHSTDEYATVVQGTVLFAHGENFDTTAGRLFGPGSFVFGLAGTPHYAWAKGPVVLSQTRSGVADFQWVHPEDDPARKKEAAAEAGKP